MYVMQCEMHLCGSYHIEETLGNECIILSLYARITPEKWELVIFVVKNVLEDRQIDCIGQCCVFQRQAVCLRGKCVNHVGKFWC